MPAFAIALAAVFALAALSKMRLLWARAAGWHPLFLRGRRRRFASVLVALSLGIDVVVVTTVPVAPRVAAFVALTALCVYTLCAWAWLGASATDCKCFPLDLLSVRSRGQLVVRNGILGLVAALAALSSPYPIGWSISSMGGGVALIAALTLAIGAFDRYGPPKEAGS